MTNKQILIGGGKAPFSKAVRAGNALYISGTIGRNEQTGEMPSSVAQQTENVMEKIKTLLEQSGTSFDSVVKAVIYLTDMRYITDVNSVYLKYFSEGQLPARSCVAVSSLPDADAKIEIEIVAEVI